MRQIANNTFNDGMLMDMQPLTTPNSVLTDCLNGTLITYDGNEFVLQSDDGNGKIDGCKLPRDFIPLGIKEYGGVVYIVSQNPFTGECEIGSFPSPERTIFKETSVEEAPQTVLDVNNLYPSSGTKSTEGITNTVLKLDFTENDDRQLLRPGDKFAIFIEDSENSSMKNFESLLELYINGVLSERRLFKFKLLRISDDGITEPIEDIVPKFNSDGSFYYTKSEIKNKESSEGLFAVYNNKVNGYLMLVLELEQVDEFDLNIENIEGIESSKDSNGNYTLFKFDIKATSKAACKNNVTGLQVKVDSESPIEQSVGNGDMEAWSVPSGLLSTSNVIVGKTETTCTVTINNKDTTKNIQLQVKPYSPFGFFGNLEYNNIVNYSKLTSAKESNVWKYYLDESLDPEIDPDKVKITYDFFVRGTKNGRNKLDSIYIEFYDVISDTSLFYPVSSVSDSKTITLNCFVGQSPDVKSATGGLDSSIIRNDEKYYLLIDKNKSGDYNECLAKLDNGNSGYTKLKELANTNIEYNTVKNIPFVQEISSIFTSNGNRYNNLGVNLNISNTRLRKNNFYVVAIVGLDYYKDSSTGKLECKKYASYNFLWTTGVFNKYWGLSGGTDDNFNLKEIPDYIDIKSKKLVGNSTWVDNTTGADLRTASDNPDYSYQSYNKLVYPSGTNTEFNSRILVNGTIENNYTISAEPTSVLKGYGTVEGTLNFSSHPTTITLKDEDYTIVENNDSSLTTDSKIDKIVLSGTNGESSYDFKSGFKVTVYPKSNRKIECTSESRNIDTFKDNYTAIGSRSDLVYSNILRISGWGRNTWKGAFIKSNSDYNNTDKIGDENNSPLGTYIGGDESHDCIPAKKAAEMISSFIGNSAFCFLQLYGGGDSDGTAWFRPEYGIRTTATQTSDKEPSGNYNNALFLLIRGTDTHYSISGSGYTHCILPFYTIGANTQLFTTSRASFIENLGSTLFTRNVETTKIPYIVPDVKQLKYHSDFDTIFKIHAALTSVNAENFKIQTKVKGSPHSLDSTFYSNIKNTLPEDVDNIGIIFKESEYTQNFKTINKSKDIIYEDSYTMSRNKFILYKDNQEFTLGNIRSDLNNIPGVIGESRNVNSSELWYKSSDTEYSSLNIMLEGSTLSGNGLNYSTNDIMTACIRNSAKKAKSNYTIYMGVSPILPNSTTLSRVIKQCLPESFKNSTR